MEELILMLVQKYPSLMMFFSVIGIFRAVFKPIMSVLEAFVLSTENKKDDAALEGFKSSKIYKALVWLVDYLSSIKLDKFKKPDAPADEAPKA